MGMKNGRTVFSMTTAQVFDEAGQRVLINCSLTAKYTWNPLPGWLISPPGRAI